MVICWSFLEGRGGVSESTLAIGVAFTGLNVSLRLVWHFRTFVALLTVIVVSLVVSCIARVTSAKGALAAVLTAAMRFVAASELGLSELRCAPTSITGTGRF